MMICRVSAKITSDRNRLPVVLWTAAALLTAAAACWRPAALLPAGRATLGPFATLAAIIAGSVLAARAGVFRALARLLTPGRAPRAAAAAAVLAFTALLSGLVNLDVAVVVATPVALQAAGQHRIPAGRLTVAVALTANAASFLLPTANITTLLLLGRAPLPAMNRAAHGSPGCWSPPSPSARSAPGSPTPEPGQPARPGSARPRGPRST
jgi:Na+/H+ antiporter NhaD/arsenite permease-like protein